VKYQRIKGTIIKITLKQRQIWTQVAGKFPQIMNNIAKRYDERQVNVCKVATSIREATALIELSYKYVCEMEHVRLFRRRK
jgi:hypothetical protein